MMIVMMVIMMIMRLVGEYWRSVGVLKLYWCVSVVCVCLIVRVLVCCVCLLWFGLFGAALTKHMKQNTQLVRISEFDM